MLLPSLCIFNKRSNKGQKSLPMFVFSNANYLWVWSGNSENTLIVSKVGVNHLAFFLWKSNCLLPLFKGLQRAQSKSYGYFTAHIPKAMQEQPITVPTHHRSVYGATQTMQWGCKELTHPHPLSHWLLGDWVAQLGWATAPDLEQDSNLSAHLHRFLLDRKIIE